MHIEVSRRLISLLRLWLCIIMSLVAFVCGIISVFSYYIGVVITAMAAIFSTFIAFYYIPRFFALYRVEVTEKALVVNRGVFIRRRYVLPCPRMIYFERTQSVLSRLFGIYYVRVHAARARLTVIGLTRTGAYNLTMLLSGESEK